MNINFHQITHFFLHFFLAKRKGHGVHSPFVYQLCEEVFYNRNEYYDFNKLRGIRRQLLSNEHVLVVEDHGAGSKTFGGKKRKVRDVAAKGISTEKQSEILYQLINLLNCRTCIELGGSLGLNTLYMASANKDTHIISIEGSRSLSEFAGDLARKNNFKNVRFVNGLFDEALPEILERTQSIDLIYIDGNHTRSATLNYFKMLLPKIHPDTVIVFDDIYWSSGMTKAWQEISQHPEVKLSIDLFHSGMVFFRKEMREKVRERLYV